MLRGEAVGTIRVVRNPALIQQISVFGGGALASRQVQQHLQIGPLSGKVAVVVRNHQFDQQHGGVRAGGSADIAQDSHRLLVGPVVQDVLQDVRVTARRDAFEERPRLDVHAIGHIVCAGKF